MIQKIIFNKTSMHILLILLAIFLPIHALIITTLKCKFGINTDIIRFWKEIVVIILFLGAFFQTMKKYSWNFQKLYKNNYLLGTVTIFSLFSFVYIFLPYFQPKLSGFLGFKYDVFFLIALVIGLYLCVNKKILHSFLTSLFVSTGIVLSIFTPWYLFGDISAVTSIFGFSSEVSTYTANSCISFAQNVEGQHRFQGSFSGPIRWSVFLTVFYLIYIGYILHFFKNVNSQLKKGFLVIPSLLIITAIFYSYSKTSLLGFIFGVSLFSYMSFRHIYKKQLSKKVLTIGGIVASLPLLGVAILKKDMFLHLGAVINRFDNLIKSIEMFLYNPLGYGLGIAGPASWTGRSIESAGSWQIAVASSGSTHKFLPENWYMQILLEQGILGLALFVGVLSIIGVKLYQIAKKRRDFFAIGMFSGYITLLFMANFTHAFEESATSYTLFFLIGLYIKENNFIKKHKNKKK